MKKVKVIFYFLGLLGFAFITFYSCTKDDPPEPDHDQIAYDAADRINGGRLYDKFWADETNFTSPVDVSIKLSDITDYGDFYRCKQCHGWDQIGSMGAYIDRGPKTGRPDVSSVDLTHLKNEAIRTVFDKIKHTAGAVVDPARTADGLNSSLGGNNMPDYGKIFTDDQIWDLVKFLREGAFDTKQLYTLNTTGTYPSGSRTFTDVGAGGNVAAGVTFYEANCAGCHGINGRDDGNNIIAINASIGRSMGEFVREKPYELQHKAVHGNLGSNPQMLGVGNATLDDIKNMFFALSDATEYPDL
jgi:thiosulfate dehydrogenase